MHLGKKVFCSVLFFFNILAVACFSVWNPVHVLELFTSLYVTSYKQHLWEYLYYVQSPKDFTDIYLIILINIKNDRYCFYPHYTEEETEHREVKGLCQGHIRFWNQVSNPDSLATVFPTAFPGHTLCCFLPSPSVPQRFLPVSLPLYVHFACRILPCWHLLIISLWA